MQPDHQDRIVSEVVGRIHSRLVAEGAQAVERALADGAYFERQRLEKEAPSPERDVELEMWRAVQAGIVKGSADGQRELLYRVTRAHAQEIVGNFSQRVYDLSTTMVPRALNFMLSASDPKGLAKRMIRNRGKLPSLDDNLKIQGRTESLKRLAKQGTVVLVPTHFSHLDSIVVGYAIDRLGLPPFSYGAGLNLFTNPMLSYFMHNLGAYKVDRKKRHSIYKDVLKEYCTVSLEMGYPNLFFPGGTRTRSGAVETRLKKGLLGCGLQAYINNLKADSPNKKIFIVPANISFQLVLEAETLIEDFLQEQGKSRYIIERDEFWDPKMVARFLFKLITLDSQIYLTIGQGYDPVGNPVNDQGQSLDPRGRPIALDDFVRKPSAGWAYEEDDDRDRQYTNELADVIVAEMHACNVLQSTHLVARAVWRLLRQHNPGMDLYRLLRGGGLMPSFPKKDVLAALETLLEEVDALEKAGSLLLDPQARPGNGEAVLMDGLKHFDCFHSSPAILPEGDWIKPDHRNLIYYYQHRLDGYGLK